MDDPFADVDDKEEREKELATWRVRLEETTDSHKRAIIKKNIERLESWEQTYE